MHNMICPRKVEQWSRVNTKLHFKKSFHISFVQHLMHLLGKHVKKEKYKSPSYDELCISIVHFHIYITSLSPLNVLLIWD